MGAIATLLAGGPMRPVAEIEVRVTKNGRPVTIMLSVQHYERLRGAAWERLAATMDRMGANAAASNLTDAKLDALLANES